MAREFRGGAPNFWTKDVLLSSGCLQPVLVIHQPTFECLALRTDDQNDKVLFKYLLMAAVPNEATYKTGQKHSLTDTYNI